jgi:hypothetical protein
VGSDRGGSVAGMNRWCSIAFLLTVAASAFGSGAASADVWWPHPMNAKWSYTWADSSYNPGGTEEAVTVSSERGPQGCGWDLAWGATGTQTGSGSVSGTEDSGTICFEDTSAGILNNAWTASPPPSNMPILCPWRVDPENGEPCGNSLASSLLNVIWGSRAPVLDEPLLLGTSWDSTGGAYVDVESANRFLGMQTVKVPAFSGGVRAAVVSSTIDTRGDLGDPYGSGVRTIWWVYGVGPVKVVFRHAGESVAPVTTVELDSTNLTPVKPPPVQNYFPLTQGLTDTYRWTNPKVLPNPEVEKVTNTIVENRSARFTVQSVRGPLRTAGDAGYTVRNGGVSEIFGTVSAVSRIKFPPLGKGLHLFTPFDLMGWGMPQILPAYPVIGSCWSSRRGSAAYQHFGVNGRSCVLGVKTVRVPAGRFRALEVKSVLTQPGYRFGSGVRYSWFAPKRGLVKLVFDHANHSVSTVVLIK